MFLLKCVKTYDDNLFCLLKCLANNLMSCIFKLSTNLRVYEI